MSFSLLIYPHVSPVGHNVSPLRLPLVSPVGHIPKCGYYDSMSITLDKRTNRWRVRKKINGKQVHLGMYPTKDSAVAAFSESPAQAVSSPTDPKSYVVLGSLRVYTDLHLDNEHVDMLLEVADEKSIGSLSEILTKIVDHWYKNTWSKRTKSS
jgi:hypothetical protein